MDTHTMHLPDCRHHLAVLAVLFCLTVLSIGLVHAQQGSGGWAKNPAAKASPVLELRW